MANVDLLARIYDDQIERAFNFEGVWAGLAANKNAELGDALELQLASDGTSYSLSSGITFAESTGSTIANLAYSTPTILEGSGATLKLNKLRTADFLLSNTVAVGIEPNLLLEGSYQVGVETMQGIDADIRAELNGQTLTSAGTAISTTAANWGNSDHQTAMDTMMRSAFIKANVAGWPQQGRYVVTSVPHAAVWAEYIIGKNINFNGPVNDRLMMMGAFPSGYGWNVIGDAAQGSDTANTTDANHALFFGVMGHGVAYGYRNLGIRIFPSEQYAGLRLQGQVVFGSKVNLTSKFMKGTVAIS